jgi:hypothetical protein
MQVDSICTRPKLAISKLIFGFHGGPGKIFEIMQFW